MSRDRWLREQSADDIITMMAECFMDWQQADTVERAMRLDGQFARLAKELRRRHRREETPGCVCSDCFVGWPDDEPF